MNKLVYKVICLGLATSMLSGCSILKRLFNRDSSSSSSGSDSQQEEPIKWDDKTQALMVQYAGEVLPWADGFGETYQTEESNGTLYIDDGVTTSFNIKDYYKDLEKAGWSSLLNENGGHELVDYYGETYYEVYKKVDAKLSYHVSYLFSEDYGNEIKCYSVTLTDKKTSDNSWSAEDTEAMLVATGDTLPFMQFGEDYYVYGESLYIQITDSYYEDLTSDYLTLLLNNGFVVVSSGDYAGFAHKTTPDGNDLYVGGEFVDMQGNVIVAILDPVVTQVNSWPSSVVNAVISGSGYTVPSFSATSYSYYTVNGAVTVSAIGSTSLYEQYAADCTSAGLMIEYDPIYLLFGYLYPVGAYPWEETFYISYGDIEDDDYNVLGFSISVASMTPTSSFSSDWPSTLINSFASELAGSAFTVPAAEKVSPKDFKYEVVEDDQTYISVTAVDNGTPSVDAIEDTYLASLISSGWWTDDSEYDEYGYFAEDQSGKVRLQFYSYDGVFTFYICAGSGDSHQASLSLNTTAVNLKPGDTYQLEATTQMISSPISWSSNNESVATVSDSGLITVSSGASIDSTATITASAGGLEATCTVTVKNLAGFTQITSTSQLVDGSKYLIVCKDSSVAFNGNLTKLDAANNTVAVTIKDDGSIASTDALVNASFTYGSTGTLKNCNNNYIGRSSDSNGLEQSTSNAFANTFSFDGDGNANIVCSGAYLRFNAANDQQRFRYYKSSSYTNQKPIQLFVLN